MSFALRFQPMAFISTSPSKHSTHFSSASFPPHPLRGSDRLRLPTPRPRRVSPVSASTGHPLDLSEDNVRRVLLDARTEFGQIFDVSAGMTGEADLAELDGPYVKLRLKGRFWHTRATVLARLSNYLKIRIPEILEVEIEDEKQLDDSPENF